MEIFIFNNQKSGEFGSFLFIFKSLKWVQNLQKIARNIILGYSASNNTNLLSKICYRIPRSIMGQRPSAIFLPFCNVAEVMIIHKMNKENLATKKDNNSKRKRKEPSILLYCLVHPTGIEYKKYRNFIIIF
jgi:hypothetical protein